MFKSADITIIGGGIIGLLTARECLLAGARVTIIDKNLIGQESSWAGGGILLPLYPWLQADAISRLVIQSHKLYPQLIQELLTHTSIDPDYLHSGLLITKNAKPDLALAWCQQHGVQVRAPAADLLTNLHTEFQNPLWLPAIHQVRNPRLLQALSADLNQRGVKFITHCEILSVHTEHSRIQQINTSQGSYPIQQLVLCTGAWTGQLWQQFFSGQVQVDIKPVKGQMLLFDAKPNTLHTIVLDGEHYLIPRRDGKILVGSSVEHQGFDKQTDLPTANRLKDFAQKLLPELSQCPLIHHWAGLRPGTPQGIPYISRHPELDNVAICAGHFRNGLAMAPASAQLLVDILLQRPTQIPADPYQLHSVH